MTEDHKQPPKTVKELGIHLGYMRESQDSMQQDIKDMKMALDQYISLGATKLELKDLEKRVRVLELTDGSKKYWTRLEGRAVLAFLSLAVSILAIWTYISGKN